MTKRALLILLLPSVLFMTLAVYALRAPSNHLRGDEREQWRQQIFEEFTNKVQSGKLQLTQEKAITLLREGRDLQKAQRDTLAAEERLLRLFGWFTLVSVAFQIYVIFRVKMVCRKPGV
jgi:hypothetical protein